MIPTERSAPPGCRRKSSRQGVRFPAGVPPAIAPRDGHTTNRHAEPALASPIAPARSVTRCRTPVLLAETYVLLRANALLFFDVNSYRRLAFEAVRENIAEKNRRGVRT